LPTQSGEPETGGCDKDDGGEEVSGKTVVAGCNASPVLHAAEHAFDDVAAPIGGAVERIRPSAACIGMTTSAPKPWSR
jgi:hypothetical protein